MPAIKADAPAIHRYYVMLDEAARQGQTHEGNVRRAFETLLRETAKDVKGWELITEQTERRETNAVRYDGTLRDSNRLPHGWWEAKDTRDDLDTEIRKKRERGYRFDNIIFEDTRHAVLYQDNLPVLRVDLRDPAQLADLLNRFYTHEIEPFTKFVEAVAFFQKEIPHIANGLKERIEAAHQDNQKFQTAFADFMELCKTALNPNISQAAVDEMLIQHMLSIRLITKIFTEGFTQRNVIAAEIEHVIGSLTSPFFNPTDFLGALDRFYSAIEEAADRLATFSEKQDFINHVYERFFQGYSVKLADTHGIVYTPQPIVDFMCAAVEEVLLTEFGVKLGDEGMYVIDPCTGTGNFAVNLLRRAHATNPRGFEQFYKQQLFANEVMLMPYYIASLNIEHEYYALSGKYEPFEGICFVDTLDLAEGTQMSFSFMTERNTARVERQKAAPITVILGNPPYNVGQVNENDNNKNRAYDIIDKRVQDTYVKASTATLRNKLFDPYVKFFRWATDRLQGRNGIVCFVSNNSFVDNIAFDGMRKHLLQDFHRIHVVDLKGNVRKDSMRDGIPIGEENTVFGLAAMVGVSITVLVRNSRHNNHKIFYWAVDWKSTRTQKFTLLEEAKTLNGLNCNELQPDDLHTWLVPEHADEFATFLRIGSKEAKRVRGDDVNVIFKSYSLGIATNRDTLVYSFESIELREKVKTFIEIYNTSVDKLRRPDPKVRPDALVDTQDTRIKWTRQVKRSLTNLEYSTFEESHLRNSVYRPFTKKRVYFDNFWNEERYQQHLFFPTSATENENLSIVVGGYGRKEFAVYISQMISDLNFYADPGQCFPFYVYDEDGSNRRENITDWALAQFRARYGVGGVGAQHAAPTPAPSQPQPKRDLTKWDIFYYVYALLHHPTYRTKFADNLKRELPRIPFAPDFWAFADAGRKLADLHLNYETVEPFPLDWVTTPGKPINYRVEKMKFNKDTDLVFNDTLTLRGIPPEAFDYKLGNRSALHWLVDQYQVSTDKRSGITSDPNRYSDDQRYIVNLVERVTQVSVETVKIVTSLPSFAAS